MICDSTTLMWHHRDAKPIRTLRNNVSESFHQNQNIFLGEKYLQNGHHFVQISVCWIGLFSVLFSLYWTLILFISRVCSSRASHSSCSWWATSWCSKRSLTSSCGILALAGSHTSSLSCATLSHRCDNKNITWLINSIHGVFVNFLSPGHFYQTKSVWSMD